VVRILGDRVVDTLARGLDAASLRQQVTANNLANVNTPGYKRGRVVFEDHLAAALQGGTSAPQGATLAATHPGHRSDPRRPHLPTAEVVTDQALGLRNDGNNVDLETETAILARNSLWYTAMSRLVSDRFNLLRHAITEGRR
jgi:flagellar basal-body rod protein FlgB